MSEYAPEVGHRVHVEFDGEVTGVQPGGDSWVAVTYHRLDEHSSYVVHLYPGTPGLTIERLPDPEPEWQHGDVVCDARGNTYSRILDRRLPWLWLNAAPVMYRDDEIVRPLTPLVRDGKPWQEATQ